MAKTERRICSRVVETEIACLRVKRLVEARYFISSKCGGGASWNPTTTTLPTSASYNFLSQIGLEVHLGLRQTSVCRDCILSSSRHTMISNHCKQASSEVVEPLGNARHCSQRCATEADAHKQFGRFAYLDVNSGS